MSTLQQPIPSLAQERGLRILRVIASIDPRTGGPVEGLLQSSAEMARLGHQTEIATLDLPEAPWVRDCPFPTHGLGPRTRAYGYSRRFVPWLKRNAANYDGVIVHGVWNYTSVGTWRALKRSKIPFFVFTHGSLDPWHRRAYPVKDVAKQLYWLALEGKVLRDADRVLFTTEEERRLARAAYRGRQGFKDKVVSYGTSDAPSDVAAQESAFRAATGIPEGRRFILFLSRIHPKKGVDILIRSFATVAAEYPDLYLVIAGPDQIGWTAELKQLAERLGVNERIYWPGMLLGDAKWGAFRSAEAFALPSHGENFGIVVAEAMACETPVLITDRVNIWREVDNSGGGIVASDTIQSFSGALQKFCRLSPGEYGAMSAQARLAFLKHFEVSAAAHDLLDLMQISHLRGAA